MNTASDRSSAAHSATHASSASAGPGGVSFADPRAMQDRLFSELSRSFGEEVPLYGGSLRVNLACNLATCDLLGQAYAGFRMNEADIDRASGERHGAIRIGTPEEYRWIARWFAAFGMEPHNFYDMSRVGAKSQPVVATAYRSRHKPEHRVFSSMLLTEYFDEDTRKRIEALLATRRVFTDRAKALIEKNEKQGGLSWDDANALIAEGIRFIFKWTGTARDHALYTHLCNAGFKIAADIACFEAHHLNHLTPNTMCIDLYTAAMEHCLGELPEAGFRTRATNALRQLLEVADPDYLRLHFKQLTAADIARFERRTPPPTAIAALVDRLIATFKTPGYDLYTHKHAGFKDYTEGPDASTPIFLRQDAYKALSEPVKFRNPGGTTTDTTHTARFGEIEQRFFAATREGRALYNRCADAAEAGRKTELADTDHAAFLASYAEHFAPFPKNLRELLKAGLAYAVYTATPAAKDLAAKGTLPTSDLHELVRLGLVEVEGIRYEDFLPVSAAGIFASNLNQYGTKATAASRPDFPQSRLEAIIGRPIIDADEEYRTRQEASIAKVREALGLRA